VPRAVLVGALWLARNLRLDKINHRIDFMKLVINMLSS
jgi:hypothetical protein